MVNNRSTDPSNWLRLDFSVREPATGRMRGNCREKYLAQTKFPPAKRAQFYRPELDVRHAHDRRTGVGALIFISTNFCLPSKSGVATFVECATYAFRITVNGLRNRVKSES